jgi:hypothetical protein
MSSASVTVFTKVATRCEPTTLSKRISIGADGRVFSDGTACRMAEGIPRTVSAPDAQTLAGVISNLRSENALALGVSEHSACRVVTVRVLKEMNGRALKLGPPISAEDRQPRAQIHLGSAPAAVSRFKGSAATTPSFARKEEVYGDAQTARTKPARP